MDDQKIMELLEGREEDALVECKKKYERFCFHIANRILGCREDAEEVVNDTYLKAWNTIPPQKPQSLKAYLGMLSRQGALNRLDRRTCEKRGGGQTEVALEELEECLSEGGADFTDQVILRDALNKFLGTLPSQTRILMIQRYWYMCSIEEIARESGMSESNVKVQLHRTRIKLKKFLEQEGFEV